MDTNDSEYSIEETKAKNNNARLDAEDEMITIPAEEMYIPDPVTPDEEILIQKIMEAVKQEH